MALIDATARFAQRREDARKNNGEFGEQHHSLPELTLVAEPAPQTLEEIFQEMDEMGELSGSGDSTLDAPIVDRYTGTPEEQEANARQRELNDLLTRAGLDRANVSDKVIAQLQDELAREAYQRKSSAEYKARQLPADPYRPSGATDREIYDAVNSIIVARGYSPDDYAPESRAYLNQWVREERERGRLRDAVAAEVESSTFERRERDEREHDEQMDELGELTPEVWDEAIEENRLRAQQKIRNLRPTNYVPLKETNAAIRAELKQFPGVKFSVRGHSYSGGASTDISYVDGPPEDQVEDVVRWYKGASVDGMTDLKSHHSVAGFDEDGVPVTTHYAADFIFTRREFSEDVKRDANAFLIQAFAAEGKEYDPNARDILHDVPQAFYARATEENGGLRGSTFAFRGHEHYSDQLLHIATTLIANERWAARRS